MIVREGLPSGDRAFSELALELFALQFECNPAYRRICEARQLPPANVEHWTQIPSVPTSAFKELDLSGIAQDRRTAVFHSSGTTEQKPSRHFHCAESLELYETSLWQWFQPNVGVDNKLISLTPDQQAAPNSSLVHMFETVRLCQSTALASAGRRNNFPLSLGARAGVSQMNSDSNINGKPSQIENQSCRLTFHGNIAGDGAWAINFPSIIQQLEQASAAYRPLTILGTAFSFVHLLDDLAETKSKFNLPAGSKVMETGGYKNRSRALPKTDLHALITQQLGVPRENIICEYGMSELSSQAYDNAIGSTGARHFHFPSWARVQIISPETGREVADGETGLIRIFDLANAFSVAAVQTEDLGIRRGAGFELLGRAQSAEPRGCSLMTA
jgi:hypothetical protein